MMRWYFDLHGGSLEVEAEDALLIAPLLPYLRELEGPPGSDVRVRLLIQRGPEKSPAAAAELLHLGSLPEGGETRYFQHAGNRWYVLPDRLSLQIRAAGTPLCLTVRPGAEALIGGTAGLVAIDAALAVTGQSLLHAAALSLPGTERAFLLLAASGAGKTTTSLALALDGFGFLTDDAAVLLPPVPATGGTHRMWGLPRALKVHQNTLALLPRLAPLLTGTWNAEGEQVLTREALSAVARVLPPRPLALTALVLLGERIAGRHTMKRIAKADLLVRFAQDNVGAGPSGIPRHELGRFEAFAATVADTPVFELRVGHALETLSAHLIAILSDEKQ